jgi:hypothetical protein
MAQYIKFFKVKHNIQSFMTYIYTKFHLSSSDNSLVTAIKRKFKYRLSVPVKKAPLRSHIFRRSVRYHTEFQRPVLSCYSVASTRQTAILLLLIGVK